MLALRTISSLCFITLVPVGHPGHGLYDYPNCPPNWRGLCAGDTCHCYTLIKEATSWYQAAVKCRESKNGIAAQLASIHSDEELRKVASMAREAKLKKIWLGMKSREDVEGGRRMVWGDGSANDYPLNWSPLVVLFWKANDVCAQVDVDNTKCSAAACDQAAGAEGFVCKSRGVENTNV
jgi:hypothetical protein